MLPTILRKLQTQNHTLKTLWAFFIAFFVGTTSLMCSINPLSKIIITSDKAVCKKISKTKNEFLFTYQDNVKVVFADKSEITSKSLEILIDGSKVNKKSAEKDVKKELKSSSHFKTIVFKGTVNLKNLNRYAVADEMEITLPSNICTLKGHVKIWQTKLVPKDMPATIESNLAVINLTTEELTFTGSTESPVCTVIDLEGHPAMQSNNLKKKKKKSKTKQSE